MKTFAAAFFVAWVSFALNFAQAQTLPGKLTGQVVDANKQAVVAVTVALVKAKDSAVVKTTQSDAQGKFVFEHFTTGQFRLQITGVEVQKYQSQMINITGQAPFVALPIIILKTSGTDLKEVAVTAQKAFIEQKIDRTVVNVGASISNTGANALEVLEKAPGVTVDENGTITFKGKPGVMVMIDDKPTYLSGDNLANYLKTLPASMLDQIELMPTPPAKYDAEGNAGVINIKTKKSKARGFNGSLAVSTGKAAYWRTNESVNLNYHQNKINLFTNASFNFNNNYRRLDVGRHYFDAVGTPTSNYTELAFFRAINNTPNLKLGMDYYASAKNTFGIVLTGSTTNGHISNAVNSTLKNGAGALDSTIIAQNTTGLQFRNKGVNLNYGHQFDSLGKALTADLDYITYDAQHNQDFQNGSYNVQNVLSATQHITSTQPSAINIYSAKTDYTLPLKNKAKFSAGVKSSYVDIDNAVNYFNVVNNISIIDNNNTNRFLYKENINAAYVNYTKDFKRFSLQAGLRAENTNVKAHQLGNTLGQDSSFNKHYTNLFPTGFLLYKLDSAGSNTLNLSYGRRITRPYYQDLNPFVVILDKYSAYGGNPFLRPQFSTNYQFTYSYKSRFSISLEYSYIDDYQVEYDYQKGDIFFAYNINLGRRLHKGINANVNLDLTKWWNFFLYAEININNYKGQLINSYLNSTNTYAYSSGNNQFKLSHGWSAELSFFYIGPATDAQFTHIARSQVNVGLQKKVLHNKGAVKIGARDLFRDNLSGGDITNIPGATATYHNDFANRIVTLGFTYNFGSTIKNLKKHDSNGAESEQNRVGN